MRDAPGRGQPTQRLFFALWPDANLQHGLHRIGQRLQGAFGGRVVAAHNIHLTLAFVGSVPTARVEELLGLGASIRASRLTLNLIETGCWKRSSVGWIGPDALPRALDDLVLDLRQRLMRSQFRVDDKPFAPHITLIRKAKCTAQANQSTQPGRTTQPTSEQQALQWDIDRFVLMRSETAQRGPEYTEVGAWPLQ